MQPTAWIYISSFFSGGRERGVGWFWEGNGEGDGSKDATGRKGKICLECDGVCVDCDGVCLCVEYYGVCVECDGVWWCVWSVCEE